MSYHDSSAHDQKTFENDTYHVQPAPNWIDYSREHDTLSSTSAC